MNKHLYSKLVKRGNINTIKELEKRDRLLERGEVVYSTEQAHVEKRNVDKNKGTIPCSDMLRSKNAFDESKMRSGRTKCITRDGRVLWTSSFSMRAMSSH